MRKIVFCLLTLGLLVQAPQIALAREAGYSQLYTTGTAEKAMKTPWLKINTQYMYLKSKQEFEIVDGDGQRISRLEFPGDGPFTTISAEARLPKKLLLMGSYGQSSLKKRTRSGTDTDWIPAISNVYEFLQSNFDCRGEIEEYSIALGYRLFDLGGEQFKSQAGDLFEIDTVIFDVILGWQSHTGEYKMSNGAYNIYVYEDLTYPEPFEGLDSYYNVRYVGPLIGAKASGSFNKQFSADIGFYYSWLKTTAGAYWNLRDYNFYQYGKGGSYYGFDLSFSYYPWSFIRITPGFHYGYFKQTEAKEDGAYPGYTYVEEDIVRNIVVPMNGATLAVSINF